MKNYIVRIYRANPLDLTSIYGVVEDIASDQIESFHSLEELQALLMCSVRCGLLHPPNLTTGKILADERTAAGA
jgi:hypothetical protein